MPSVETTVIALDEHRSFFQPDTVLALPPHEALIQALDKRATCLAAAELGIRVPKSCCPVSVDEGMAFGDGVGYPLVMKPRALSSFQGVDGVFDFKVRYARHSDELKRAMQAFSREGAFPLLQEYMYGLGVAHSFLMVDGEPRGLYQHRRVRECPLTGGVASVIASEPVDPQLLDWTNGLKFRLGWEGIAQVEYRHDRQKDLRVLIEINGRIWAPSQGRCSSDSISPTLGTSTSQPVPRLPFLPSTPMVAISVICVVIWSPWKGTFEGKPPCTCSNFLGSSRPFGMSYAIFDPVLEAMSHAGLISSLVGTNSAS